MMNNIEEIKEALQMLSLPEKKEFFPRFFKTGVGEYGEGDEFIGVTVPDQRKIANEYAFKINLNELSKLLSSKIHEHRHCALLILVRKFEKSKSKQEQQIIVDFYIENLGFVNNWDLVDNSSYKILGKFCFENKKDEILKKLSKDNDIWHKRIAIVSTMYYIKKGELNLTIEIALQNLHHKHDLLQKANGWLLRELGKKNENTLILFLNEYHQDMPRVTLRYSIEKLEVNLRNSYMKGLIK